VWCGPRLDLSVRVSAGCVRAVLEVGSLCGAGVHPSDGGGESPRCAPAGALGRQGLHILLSRPAPVLELCFRRRENGQGCGARGSRSGLQLGVAVTRFFFGFVAGRGYGAG
jgi:hypothetical protein